MEKYYRKKQKLLSKDPIVFQAIEWIESNEKKETDEEEDHYSPPKYTMRIFGVTDNGLSVCVTVDEFTPFFYIKVPNKFEKRHIKKLINTLKSKIEFQYRKSIVEEKVKMATKKDIYGFKGNDNYEKFVRLVFDNSWAMKKYKKLLDDPIILPEISSMKLKFPQYESNLDTILKMIHIKDIDPAGWIKIEKYNIVKVATTQIDIQTSWLNLQPFEDSSNADILQGSYDIECYSSPLLNEASGKYYYPFPQATIKDNEIYQIATCFKKVNTGLDDFYVKTLLTLKKFYTEEDIELKEKNEKNKIYIIECDTEKQLLLKWAELIRNVDPDILYQYNGDQFDCKYINIRCQYNNIETEFNKILSRLRKTPSTMKKSTFSSGAYGTSEFERLVIPGRINFDILVYIKKEYKETSYKLDDISEKYLKENKLDVTPVDIFKAYEKGTPQHIKDIGLYCIQDTLLPQKLSDKLSILQSLISMANVTCVSIKMLIERGQQIKAYSQIVKMARQKNFLMPTLDYNRDASQDEKFQGATVLKATPGFYADSPITVLDFASLYPSILIAHNLCYSSFINETDPDKVEEIKKHYKVNNFSWEEDTVDEFKNKIIKKYSYNFVENATTVLPGLLEDLALQRKKYKKLMNSEEDVFQKEIYNKTQLAYKLSMNSVYGVLGAKMIGCKPIAATVTAVGRKMIGQTLEYIEKTFDATAENEVIYGDSVTEDTIIILKNKKTNLIEVKQIGSVYGSWVAYKEFKPDDTISSNRREKEQCITEQEYEVWSDQGWTSIRRLIRHKCNKKIYRITTRSGSVDVTEDHSLLTPNLVKVKPEELVKGNELLHVKSYPIENCREYDIFTKTYIKTMNNMYNPNQTNITGIEELKRKNKEEFVYDLETEIGRYAAGIGGIVVKNTDSVFVKFNTENTKKLKEVQDDDKIFKKEITEACIEEAFEIGKKAAIQTSRALFKNPIKLEFEKVYYPMLLLSKKRYIANFYETSSKVPDKLEMKGVVLKRRDNCELLKTCYKGMIDPIMEHQKQGITIAIEFIKDRIQELIDNRIDLSQLVITKTLKTGYKNQNIPHLVLARKMTERDPGNAPCPNDRVSFVYVETKDTKAKQYEKVEDPVYVKENNLKLDALYYIEHQLEKPILQVLELLTSNPEKIFKDIKRNYINQRDGQTTLLSWIRQ